LSKPQLAKVGTFVLKTRARKLYSLVMEARVWRACPGSLPKSTAGDHEWKRQHKLITS